MHGPQKYSMKDAAGTDGPAHACLHLNGARTPPPELDGDPKGRAAAPHGLHVPQRRGCSATPADGHLQSRAPDAASRAMQNAPNTTLTTQNALKATGHGTGRLQLLVRPQNMECTSRP